MSEKKNKKHSSKDVSPKNEESFRVQYNAIPIPTCTWKRVGKEFKLINYNDAALKITEGKILDYVGRTAKEMYADQPEILKGIKRCFSERAPIRRQIHYRFKSAGKGKYLLASYNFVPPDLILVHIEDITELKHMEINLQESEERFRNLMEYIPGVSVQGYDTDGKVFYWNKASEEVYGYTSKEAIGKNLADLIIPPDIKPIFKKCLEIGKKVEKSGEFRPSEELMLLHKKGHLVPVYSMHTAVCIKGKKPLLYCVDVDLSERKKAEERLSKLNECFVSLGPDAKKNIEMIANAAGELIGGVCILYNRLEKERGLLCTWGIWNEPEGYEPEDNPEGHICYDVIKGGKEEPVIIDNMEGTKYEKTDPNVKKYKLKSYLGCPVRLKGETVGSFCICGVKKRKFTSNEIKIMGMLAQVVANEEERKHSQETLQESEERLRESEKKYHMMVEKANEAVVIAQDERLKLVNPKASEITGYSEEELLSKRFIELVHPDDRKKVLNFYKKRLGGKQPPSIYSFRIVDKKGHVHWVNISAVLFSWNGRPATLNLLSDITKQKQAEERYRILFHSSPDGICEIDEDEVTVISINHAMAKNFGCKPEDMIGKAFSDFLPKKLYDSRYKIGRKALDENKIQEFEDERAGRYFYSTFVPVISTDGKKHLQIISRDVTDQRRADRKYKTLFEFSRDAIMMLSPPSWAFTAGNPSAFKMFNAKNEKEFTASDPWTLSPEFQPDGQLSSEKAKKMIEKAMKTGSNFFEWTHKRLDGKEFPATVLLTKIELEGKQLLQATVRDITKQKEIEKSLQEAHDELEKRVKERTAELTETYEKLAESERKYRLLFDVSPIGIGLIDVEGNILDGNPAMEKITGYSMDELKSEGLGGTYVNLDDYKRLVKELQKKGRVCDWEIKLKNREGGIYYVLLDVEKIELSGWKGYITIQRDISKQKDDEQEIIRTKNRLQNVIDGASEIILAIDQNNNISTWNKTAENLTRYKQKQIVGKNLAKLKVFDRPKELEEYIKNVYEGYTSGLDLILRTRLGSKRVFRVHGSIIEKGKQLQGVILIGYDVTGDSEAHGKLLPGNGYLLTDENIKPSLDLFVGLITSKHNGLLITRGRPNNIQNMFPSIDVEIVDLSQESVEGVECIHDPNALAEKIDKFTSKHSNPVVLFDRIDYLLSNFSFEEIMNATYKINDIITRNNAILLLRLNPLILERQQFMLIKEELKTLPSKRVEDIELEDTLFDILMFVDRQSKQNVLVSYQKISQEFSISKVTTGKRLNILRDKNLVSIKMKGRLKSVSLTGKGDALLNRRMAV
ncbi:MAG: PAS domain S-box protein [Candidatus Thermoplasmatota archaeon]|nr:PAS domain S-box protein [Candidatus Thermoplasmatota archaeon]